jgi:hypothetical protein
VGDLRLVHFVQLKKGALIMNELRSTAQETAEDIFFGQVVIIWARWFVILAATIAVLWSADDVGELTTAMLLLVPMIVINFFVHGRYMMEKPANQLLLIALSVVDVIIITLIILFWHKPGGFESQFYIYYYPVILAFAFVFPVRISALYTVLAAALYTGACLVYDASFVNNPTDIEGMLIRLITMVSVGGLATYYWRVQRKRRRESVTGQPGIAPGGQFAGETG